MSVVWGPDPRPFRPGEELPLRPEPHPLVEWVARQIDRHRAHKEEARRG